VRKITGPVFYAEPINSSRYVRQIVQPFFRKLTNEEKICGHFQQDSAIVKTNKNFMQTLNRVSG
jgi:hypothetical protein